MPVIVTFEAELWRWAARSEETWTFVSVPADVSDEIHERFAGRKRGFGSLRVRATVGGSTWTTSIFPGSDAYVLPVKRAVRVAEALDIGDPATVTIELLDA